MALKSLVPRQQARLQILLVEARLQAGLTQVEIAARLGRPQSFVSKYESGNRGLDVIEFLEVSKAVRADPCTILRSVGRVK